MDSSQNTVLGSGGNGMLAAPLNDTAAAVDDPKQNLNQVIDSIQKTLGQLHQLYLIVSYCFTASSSTETVLFYQSFVLVCYSMHCVMI